MRCPVCGYDFNKAILEVGFHKCDYHPDMIYICDGCKREVHHAYKEKLNWIEPKGIKIPFQKEYTYLCLDCMREYGHYHDLLECDKQMSTEQGENLWKEEKMFVQKEIEISENYREIEAIYDKYNKQILKGQPCWLYDNKGYRIGQIYELWILEDNDQKYKLIGKCEIWQRDYSVWNKL